MSQVTVYVPSGVTVEIIDGPVPQAWIMAGSVAVSLYDKPLPVIPVEITIPAGYFNMHCLNYPYNGVTSQTPNPTDVVLGTVRRGLHWDLIEPTQGVRNFNVAPYYIDIYVDTHLARGFKTALIIDPSRHPAWAAQGGTSSPQYRCPALDVYWTDYVTAAAQHYRGKLASIEFANEPSNDWLGTHAEMARMFRLGRDAAKAVDPTVPIVGPSCQSLGVAGHGIAWMRSFFNASDGAGGTGKDHLDVVGVHYYPSPTTDPAKMFAMATNVKNVMSECGVALPIWNMESGKLQTTANPTFASNPLSVRLFNFKAHCMLPAVAGCAKTIYYAYDTNHMGWYNDTNRSQFVDVWNQMRSFEGKTIRTIQDRMEGGWNLNISGTQFVI